MVIADLPPSSASVERGHDQPVMAWSTFEDFYRIHRDSVARTLALTLGDGELGFEAADEAMARAYERWGQVQVYANPEGWVYRVGFNWARSWLRRRKRGAAKDPLVASPEWWVDRPIDTDLAAAIAELSDDHRAVVVLRFYREWSVEETADALDVAPGTVKSRLSRALDQLQAALTDRDGNRAAVADSGGHARTHRSGQTAANDAGDNR